MAYTANLPCTFASLVILFSALCGLAYGDAFTNPSNANTDLSIHYTLGTSVQITWNCTLDTISLIVAHWGGNDVGALLSDVDNTGSYTWRIGQLDNIDDDEIARNRNFVLIIRSPSGTDTSGISGFVNGQLQSRGFVIDSDTLQSSTSSASSSSSSSTSTSTSQYTLPTSSNPATTSSPPSSSTTLAASSSATVAPADTPSSSGSGGLSTGAKAGIGAGVGVGALALIGAGFFFGLRRSRRAARDAGNAQSAASGLYPLPPPSAPGQTGLNDKQVYIAEAGYQDQNHERSRFLPPAELSSVAYSDRPRSTHELDGSGR